MFKFTFKEVAHHYIGCRILIDENKTNILTDHLLDREHIPISALNERYKPLLRPRIDMVTKEVNRFIFLLTQNPEIPYFKDRQVSAMIYLASRGIDAFNLIENNEAIDITKMTNEKDGSYKMLF